jgi:hypothetical protein
MKQPAILDGPPAFPDGLPFARPYTPPLEKVTARLQPSYERGQLTNGPVVRALEEQAAERLGVPHVVAVSSCTAGLMLVIQALCPEGPVLLPSFTFSASGHAGNSTLYMPWSKPRSASSATAMPAPLTSSETRAARAGEPGAGY